MSSGEAELSGICRGASEAIGLQALCRDLGIELALTVLTDATAAIGICRRRGLGKVLHLAVADLWVQDKVRAGDFSLKKVAGGTEPRRCTDEARCCSVHAAPPGFPSSRLAAVQLIAPCNAELVRGQNQSLRPTMIR